MSKNPKKYLYWFVLPAIVVLVAGGALGYFLSMKGVAPWDQEPEYSAVYLITGDLYFGELGWFPKMHLKKALYLQRGVVDSENREQFAVSAFEDASWQPAGKIYISPDQVVWTAPISSDSPLIQAFDSL